jgi:uncharacterized sporulation protein YeaH/YhbH (DUF444 family)
VNDILAPSRLMRIVDRRADPPGRGAVNREKFIRRYKDDIKRAVDEEIDKRGIKDIGKGGKVSIPGRGLREPRFVHDEKTGNRDFVLPGNREYLPGDRIDRPEGGDGQNQGREPGEGESSDNFSFALSREEFLALFFDDLELPNLERTKLDDVLSERTRRAGYSRDGAPGNLSAPMTVLMSIARRIALRGAIQRQIEELEAEVAGAELTRRAEIEEQLERLFRRRQSLPFIEDIDQRFRARAPMPAPYAQAVMLCLMDVSGSMDERKKDLAKRFFALLYLFLERKYGAVEVVFIRHTESAEEVDEQTFFYDPQSGGTLVRPALELADRVIRERYSGGDWNVYVAQASDGDCGTEDGRTSAELIEAELLPRVRYFAYVDIPGNNGWFDRPSDLWQSYQSIEDAAFQMRQVHARSDIWPVFRQLFAKKEHA